MSNEIQLWSDFSQFGVHLVPITLTKIYGLGDKVGLLLLLYDPYGCISQTYQRGKLTILWQKEARTVYIVPASYEKGFLPASELLHRLGLSMIAPPNTLSSKQLMSTFIKLMGDDYLAFYQTLYSSQLLGKNHLGESVFSSNLGRYTLGQSPYRYQLANKDNTADARLLFAANPAGDIEDAHLVNCMKAFLLSDRALFKQTLDEYIDCIGHIPVPVNEMQEFVELSATIINKLEPKTIKSPLFKITCYQALYTACAYVLYDFIQNKRLTIALLRKLIKDFERIQQCLPIRKSGNIETPFISMQLAVILAFLINPDQSDVVIFSDGIAELTILAAIKRCIVVETRSNLYRQIQVFKQEHADANIDEYDSNNHEKTYKYNIGIYPHGLNYVEVVIPFFNQENKIFLDAYTDKYAISRVIHSLNKREPNGRSVYLISGEPVGVLGENYMFYAWLQAYFLDVTIIDLSGNIFAFDDDIQTMRMIIVGETQNPRPENKEALAQKTQHIHKDTEIEVKTNLDMLVNFCEAIITKNLSKNYLIQDFEDGEVGDSRTVGLFKSYKLHTSKFKDDRPSAIVKTKVDKINPVNPFVNLKEIATPLLNFQKNPITLDYFDELLEAAIAQEKAMAEAAALAAAALQENGIQPAVATDEGAPDQTPTAMQDVDSALAQNPAGEVNDSGNASIDETAQPELISRPVQEGDGAADLDSVLGIDSIEEKDASSGDSTKDSDADTKAESTSNRSDDQADNHEVGEGNKGGTDTALAEKTLENDASNTGIVTDASNHTADTDNSEYVESNAVNIDSNKEDSNQSNDGEIPAVNANSADDDENDDDSGNRKDDHGVEDDEHGAENDDDSDGDESQAGDRHGVEDNHYTGEHKAHDNEHLFDAKAFDDIGVFDLPSETSEEGLVASFDAALGQVVD